MATPPQARLSTYLDPELKELLDAFVERSGISQKAVIHRALATWLEEAEALELIEERRRKGRTVSSDEAKRLLEL